MGLKDLNISAVIQYHFEDLKFLFHNCVLSVSINKQSFNCYADVNVSAYPNVRKDTFVKYLDILKG